MRKYTKVILFNEVLIYVFMRKYTNVAKQRMSSTIVCDECFAYVCDERLRKGKKGEECCGATDVCDECYIVTNALRATVFDVFFYNEVPNHFIFWLVIRNKHPFQHHIDRKLRRSYSLLCLCNVFCICLLCYRKRSVTIARKQALNELCIS
jgi:hypothetical protein